MTKTTTKIVWRFQRPDGKWMLVARDTGGPGGAQWSEWVDSFDDATAFLHADGLKGDHRWESMLEGAKPCAFTQVITVVDEPKQ